MKLIVFCVAALLALVGIGDMRAEAQAARLGPGDRVQLQVLQRPDLNGEYAVRGDGTISMHLAGRFPVIGMTLSQLEDVIRDRLRETLSTELSVVAQGARMRDVYVLGDVAAPGPYRSRPGLNILQLLASAGGVVKNGGLSDSFAPQTVSDRLQVQRELSAILIELARLQAERNQTDTLEISDELRALAGDDLPMLVSEQQAILDTARLREAQIQASANEQLALTQSEAVSHAAREDLLNEQIAETSGEAERRAELRQRDLVTEQSLSDVRTSLRQDRVDLLAQSIATSQNTRDAALLSARMAERAAEQRLQIASRTATLSARARELRAQLDAVAQTPLADLALGRVAVGTAQVQVRLLRPGQTGLEELPVDAGTTLLPGDVVEVAIIPPALLETSETDP